MINLVKVVVFLVILMSSTQIYNVIKSRFSRLKQAPVSCWFNVIAILLETSSPNAGGWLINIHLEDSSDADPLRFLELLTQFGLRQHVRECNHSLGGIPDLVITSDDAYVCSGSAHPSTGVIGSLTGGANPPSFTHSTNTHTIPLVRGWKSLD